MDDMQAFPDENHRFTLGLSPISQAEFFRAESSGGGDLTERRRILAGDSTPYIAATPDSGPLIKAFANWTSDWQHAPSSGSEESLDEQVEPLDRVINLGMALEPDFVLLAKDRQGVFRVKAGCVCFPSSWRLQDKMGLTVAEVHEVVSNLNSVLAIPIDKLLEGLKPGKCWGRWNWGLTSSPELNQHPDRGIPSLVADVGPESIWLRLEHQLLASLPGGEGIIFGIRIAQTRIDEVLRHPAWSRRLARSLATMPPEMVAYKRLSAIRQPLLAWLSAIDE